MQSRVCVACGAMVYGARFRIPVSRQVCTPCRNRKIARDRRQPWKGVTGADHPCGNKANKKLRSRGYVWVRAKNHPRARFGWVKRATLVLERKLGRYLLPGHFAHHKDQNTLNDRPSNLEEMDHSEHQRHHMLGNQYWRCRKSK